MAAIKAASALTTAEPMYPLAQRIPRVPHGFDHLGAFVDHVRQRSLERAFTEASVSHWRRRALVWADVAPKPTDYNGRATPEQLAEASARCLAISQACTAHADLLEECAVDPLVITELLTARAEVFA